MADFCGKLQHVHKNKPGLSPPKCERAGLHADPARAAIKGRDGRHR
jgi:hypothetical protein